MILTTEGLGHPQLVQGWYVLFSLFYQTDAKNPAARARNMSEHELQEWRNHIDRSIHKMIFRTAISSHVKQRLVVVAAAFCHMSPPEPNRHWLPQLLVAAAPRRRRSSSPPLLVAAARRRRSSSPPLLVAAAPRCRCSSSPSQLPSAAGHRARRRWAGERRRGRGGRVGMGGSEQRRVGYAFSSVPRIGGSGWLQP